LITSTNVFVSTTDVNTLGNIGALFVDGNEDVASVEVETCNEDGELWVVRHIINYSGSKFTLGGVIETNPLDGITDNLVVVEDGGGSDFTEDHNHTSLSAGLCK
jgi:hypothetical protein